MSKNKRYTMKRDTIKTIVSELEDLNIPESSNLWGALLLRVRLVAGALVRASESAAVYPQCGIVDQYAARLCPVAKVSIVEPDSNDESRAHEPAGRIADRVLGLQNRHLDAVENFLNVLTEKDFDSGNFVATGVIFKRANEDELLARLWGSGTGRAEYPNRSS